ncbi:MAG: efflux RND transporter periplasmic adaptor subunit [Aeromicrobium sp.]
MVAGVAVAILATAGILTSCGSSEDARPTTAAVQMTAFSPGIASTGSLSAHSEQNLGFAKGGQLTSVLVKVGDHVEAGQELASIDPLPAKQALAAQRAQLQAAVAQLDKAKDSPAVDDAEDSLDQAKDVLDAVRNQVAQQEQADQVAVDNAQQQFAADQNSAASAASVRSTACMSGPSPNCTSAQASESAANQKALSSQNALRSAEQKLQIDQASGQVSIENAQQGVVMARNSVDTSSSDRPHTIDQQQALVAAARAAVVQAERDLANTTLRAPVAGTVTALNGAVGEYVAPSTGTSALAPGSDAAIPGASGSSSGGSASSANPAAATSPARPGGAQFLVLSDVHQLQVVALFNESDAAALEQDESVDVTFDALPDLTVPGTVASVAPSGTSVAGVISYYVTVNLDDTDPRLKAGQTATVSVSNGDSDEALTVPTPAVHTYQGRTAVTVVEGDKTRNVTIETGTVKNGRTEVLSGLRAGQRVALPSGNQGGGRS